MSAELAPDLREKLEELDRELEVCLLFMLFGLLRCRLQTRDLTGLDWNGLDCSSTIKAADAPNTIPSPSCGLHGLVMSTAKRIDLPIWFSLAVTLVLWFWLLTALLLANTLLLSPVGRRHHTKGVRIALPTQPDTLHELVKLFRNHIRTPPDGLSLPSR